MSDPIEITAEIDWSDPVECEPVDDGGRKGLPSASEYPRMHACPGYYLMKKNCFPDGQKGNPNEAAISGTRIHAALAEPLIDQKLTDEEEDMRDRCARQWDSLMRRIFTENGYSAGVRHEHRIFYKDQISGQFDREATELHNKVALVVDFKTGRVPVPKADTNLQARIYAVLAKHENPSITKVYAAIIQPWVSQDPIIAEYDEESLKAATAELDAVLRISKDPAAKRIPGEQCKYCPCKAKCPEAQKVPMALANVNPATLVSDFEIAAFLDRISLAESVIAAVKKEAKTRLAAGSDIPGWELAPGRTLSKITNPELVFARVCGLNVNQDGFLSAVTVQKGALKNVIKAATGLKGKGLDEQLNEVLAGCTEDRTSEPMLKKKEDV